MKDLIDDGSPHWDHEYSQNLVALDENPDARIGIYDGMRMCAHAALWWREAACLAEETIGVLGGFCADDESSAEMLLKEAQTMLRDQSCSMVVGPMNGNTWRKHRFVSWSDGSPHFLLEPATSEEHRAYWLSAGFKQLADYSSSRVELGRGSTISDAVVNRLSLSGVRTRGVEVDRLEQELAEIHRVCLESFRDNFLYVPMEQHEFVTRYMALRAWISPEYVRVAEWHGMLCGFVFSLPDPLAQRDGRAAELIVKTLAVLPKRHFAGLGSLLVDQVHAAAEKNGLQVAIHALQRNDNSSRRITGRHQGVIFRKYEMLAKKI
ncbi:MAG: hypothetical protein EAZ42_01915 [Verrucomicrobia bacterium]|nr:MAG: hypothetical protein EAZ42_01915 [Verrucomicrobiota bacterium]